MSLLTIAQAVADFTGFERPTTVVGNTDPIARQLFAFINREGKQLMRSRAFYPARPREILASAEHSGCRRVASRRAQH